MSFRQRGESSEEYVSKDHCSALLATIKALYGREELCDVILCAGGEEAKAHRLVLAASCPYFEAMFTGELAESRQDKIYLQGVDHEALKHLVDFIYCGKISLSESNVEKLLPAASLWQLVPVIKFCCHFLQERVGLGNCVGIMTLADAYGCQDLFNYCQKFIMQHYSDVAVTEEFVLMPHDLLVDLLKSDELRVHNEEEVLDSVLKWLQYNADSGELLTLLQHIKLPLIDWPVLTAKLYSNSRVKSDATCSELLAGLKQSHPDLVPSVYADTSSCKQRKYVNQDTRIYVVGGEKSPGRTTVNTVQAYDPHLDAWQELSVTKIGRRGAGVCLMDGLLYVCGGSDGLEALSSVECYDPRTDEWSTTVEMNMGRSSVGAASIDGHLYAIGGYDGYSSCLRSVECYSKEEEKWNLVAEMNIARSMVCVGVLGKSLVAVGGYDGSGDLSSCELYNIVADQWSLIADMNYCRCMAGVGTVSGRLYVVGGCDLSQSLATAEVYDAEQNRWCPVATMSTPRSGLGCAVVGQRLYAIGGQSSSECCSSVECYHPGKNQWSPVSGMPCSKRRFGCCS